MILNIGNKLHVRVKWIKLVKWLKTIAVNNLTAHSHSLQSYMNFVGISPRSLVREKPMLYSTVYNLPTWWYDLETDRRTDRWTGRETMTRLDHTYRACIRRRVLRTIYTIIKYSSQFLAASFAFNVYKYLLCKRRIQRDLCVLGCLGTRVSCAKTAQPAQHFSVAGLMTWNSQILAAQTVLGVYLKRRPTCSRVSSAPSALRVCNDYVLYKSTYSLTHSLTHEMLFGTLGTNLCQPKPHMRWGGVTTPQQCSSTTWNTQQNVQQNEFTTTYTTSLQQVVQENYNKSK